MKDQMSRSLSLAAWSLKLAAWGLQLAACISLRLVLEAWCLVLSSFFDREHSSVVQGIAFCRKKHFVFHVSISGIFLHGHFKDVIKVKLRLCLDLKSFIMVKSLAACDVKLYEGSSVKQLVACGLELEACCLGLAACGLKLSALGA